MGRIIVLVGVPGAGKSTWVQKEFQGECTVISSDNILEEIAAEEGKTYDEVFSKYIKAANAMCWKDFEQALMEEQPVIIVDRTNMSVKSRRIIFDKLKQSGKSYDVEAIVFKTPPYEEHQRRLNSRISKTIPANVIKSMQESYEEPTIKEGFTKTSIRNWDEV